jgi:hypothetical protein
MAIKELPKTVLKTARFIRQDATLEQITSIERELHRVIQERKHTLLQKESTYENRKVQPYSINHDY